MTIILRGDDLFDREEPTSFCQVFKDELARLFSLALLLTADPVKAERCFISSLNDSVSFPSLEKERVLFWSKRFIIHNAIRLVGAAFENEIMALGVSLQSTRPPALLHALLQLAPFERFVFVLSILEGLEEDEICSFLKCSLGDLAAARERSLYTLLGFDVIPCISTVAIRDQIRSRPA